MASPSQDYRYSVEFNIHGLDAPGTRLIKNGDIYINICLLGIHKRTRLMPPYLPMHIDQKLYFDKVFKFCYDYHDVIDRLEREHVLIELIQNDVPSPILLASYETTAKEFLYPYSWDRVEYTGLRRYVLLSRTIDFPGISPSFEFSTSPSIDDVTGLSFTSPSNRRQTIKTVRSKSPTWKPTSVYPNRSLNQSRTITAHTVSSAVKSDHGQRETKEKLHELAVERDINYVVPLDKTKGRPPFVVRHVNNDLIGRKPKSHKVLNDGLVVNDFTLSRPESVASLYPYNDGLNQSRSLSPVLGRSIGSTGRARSPSPTRRSPKLSQSMDFERRGRSLSSERYLSNDYDDDENYLRSPSRYSMSPTLNRGSFRYRYRHSPAADLSDKVIHTLRRNLDSYSSQPWHRYYSAYRYSDEHIDDDDILERSIRLTQE